MSLFKKPKLITLHDGRVLNVEHVELIEDRNMQGNTTKRIRLTSGKWMDDLHVSDTPRIIKQLGGVK